MDSDNKKISQLTQVTSLNDSDLFIVSIDVPGAPKTRGIQKSNVAISGTWIPTAVKGTNITNDSDVVPAAMNYTRVGSQVTFNGMVQIDTAATGAFTCYLSLPVASDFTTVGDANGNGTNPSSSPASQFSIREDTTNNRLQLDGYAQVDTNLYYRYSGGYIIK